jgi:hypothetical protein
MKIFIILLIIAGTYSCKSNQQPADGTIVPENNCVAICNTDYYAAGMHYRIITTYKYQGGGAIAVFNITKDSLEVINLGNKIK